MHACHLSLNPVLHMEASNHQLVTFSGSFHKLLSTILYILYTFDVVPCCGDLMNRMMFSFYPPLALFWSPPFLERFTVRRTLITLVHWYKTNTTSMKQCWFKALLKPPEKYVHVCRESEMCDKIYLSLCELSSSVVQVSSSVDVWWLYYYPGFDSWSFISLRGLCGFTKALKKLASVPVWAEIISRMTFHAQRCFQLLHWREWLTIINQFALM